MKENGSERKPDAVDGCLARNTKLLREEINGFGHAVILLPLLLCALIVTLVFVLLYGPQRLDLKIERSATPFDFSLTSAPNDPAARWAGAVRRARHLVEDLSSQNSSDLPLIRSHLFEEVHKMRYELANLDFLLRATEYTSDSYAVNSSSNLASNPAGRINSNFGEGNGGNRFGLYVPFYMYQGGIFERVFNACEYAQEGGVGVSGHKGERLILEELRDHPFRVQDPAKALLFVVPAQLGAILAGQCDAGLGATPADPSDKSLDEQFRGKRGDAIREIEASVRNFKDASSGVNYYERNGGNDHLFLSTDWRVWHMMRDGGKAAFWQNMIWGRYMVSLEDSFCQIPVPFSTLDISPSADPDSALTALKEIQAASASLPNSASNSLNSVDGVDGVSSSLSPPGVPPPTGVTAFIARSSDELLADFLKRPQRFFFQGRIFDEHHYDGYATRRDFFRALQDKDADKIYPAFKDSFIVATDTPEDAQRGFSVRRREGDTEPALPLTDCPLTTAGGGDGGSVDDELRPDSDGDADQGKGKGGNIDASTHRTGCRIDHSAPLYRKMAEASQYHIVIRGDDFATARLYDALQARSIIVLVSDGLYDRGLAFQCHVDWSSLIISISEREFRANPMKALKAHTPDPTSPQGQLEIKRRLKAIEYSRDDLLYAHTRSRKSHTQSLAGAKVDGALTDKKADGDRDADADADTNDSSNDTSDGTNKDVVLGSTKTDMGFDELRRSRVGTNLLLDAARKCVPNAWLWRQTNQHKSLFTCAFQDVTSTRVRHARPADFANPQFGWSFDD